MLSAETERLIVINPDVEGRKKLRQKHPAIGAHGLGLVLDRGLSKLQLIDRWSRVVEYHY